MSENIIHVKYRERASRVYILSHSGVLAQILSAHANAGETCQGGGQKREKMARTTKEIQHPRVSFGSD